MASKASSHGSFGPFSANRTTADAEFGYVTAHLNPSIGGVGSKVEKQDTGNKVVCLWFYVPLRSRALNLRCRNRHLALTGSIKTVSA